MDIKLALSSPSQKPLAPINNNNMNTTFKILFSITFFITKSGFAISEDWFKFKTKTFKIEFPFEPKSETNKINSAVGELTMNIHMYDASTSSTKDENLVYMVISTEYPEASVSSDKKEILESVFRNGIDGAVKNVKGKLLTEKNIEIDGYPGREIRVDYQDGLAIIKMRFYLVKNTMYIIQLITLTENEINKAGLKFMNSFKLVN